MSFTQIWGNFQLTEMYHKLLTEPSDLGYHLHYKSNISTNSGNLTIDIRVYQAIEEPPLPDGCMAFVFGKFYMSEPHTMQIEAVHIFPYHRSITGVMLQAFRPRVVISGYICQETEVLENGTNIIFVNAMGFAREHYNVVTVLGAMVANLRWPIQPPTPKIYSPVQITGFIDCIDTFNQLPVITVEDITLEVGNKIVAEKVNQARVDLALICYHKRSAFPVARRPFHRDIEFNYSWAYSGSYASLSSIPSYNTPYPQPFPLDGAQGFRYPMAQGTVFDPLRQPRFTFRASKSATKNIEKGHASHSPTLLSPIVSEVKVMQSSAHNDTAASPKEAAVGQAYDSHVLPPPIVNEAKDTAASAQDDMAATSKEILKEDTHDLTPDSSGLKVQSTHDALERKQEEVNCLLHLQSQSPRPEPCYEDDSHTQEHSMLAHAKRDPPQASSSTAQGIHGRKRFRSASSPLGSFGDGFATHKQFFGALGN
ncbi:hypothetical protein M422DRAFT_265260 [Sphaerobolus stellatus SS14]|uniref:Uncharacterized protein n=1 Tax=Sphaerobolus stellatus (strain SS14) TaxID=990650 RepID=A0A0C9V633_SPHS4|nr:hypothetical protein M422DRAFT_265260 [Sphaerobolus stellatus SS14]